jgi:hypothetical protein
MKKSLSIFAVYLLALSIAACSSLFKNKGVNNLTEKPLALTAQAYALMVDADSKATVTYDLERAYHSNGVTQAVINHLLKKETKPETADDKDDNMTYLAEVALDEKKPTLKRH